MEVTENSDDIIEVAKMMLNRTTGSFRTRSLVYFPNTIRGKETFQVGKKCVFIWWEKYWVK